MELMEGVGVRVGAAGTGGGEIDPPLAAIKKSTNE